MYYIQAFSEEEMKMILDSMEYTRLQIKESMLYDYEVDRAFEYQTASRICDALREDLGITGGQS